MNEKVMEALDRWERMLREGAYADAWECELESLVQFRAHIEGLEARLVKIDRMAACGTAESFLALSDDAKRQWFASAVIESSERKAAEARVRELEEWVEHRVDCAHAQYVAEKCDCGLDDVMQENRE
jgi:hypothetical protein